MSWLIDLVRPKIKTFAANDDVPEGLWISCKKCQEMIFKKDISEHLNVCPSCDDHMYISNDDRIKITFDEYEFIEYKHSKDDPLKFVDKVKYTERLKKYRKKTNMKDILTIVKGSIGKQKIIGMVMDFGFMGGSMGQSFGNGFVTAVREAVRSNLPLIIFTASGGARMQESVIALFQMPKTVAALSLLKNHSLPYIVIATNPTMGGVSASFAMLGDITIAEPKALIGFTGKRVIEDTLKEKLSDDFQTAEYMQKRGAIDIICHRRDLKQKISNILGILLN